MAKKDEILTPFKDMKTTALLDWLETEKDDDVWMKCWEEIMERSPFSGLDECIGNNETRIEGLEGEIKKLKSLLRSHKHLGDDVVTKI